MGIRSRLSRLAGALVFTLALAAASVALADNAAVFAPKPYPAPPVGWTDPGTPDAADVRLNLATFKIVKNADGTYTSQLVPLTTPRQEADPKLQELSCAYQRLAWDYYNLTKSRTETTDAIKAATLAEHPDVAASSDVQLFINTFNAECAERGLDIVAWNAETQTIADTFWKARQAAYAALLNRFRQVPR